MNISIQNVTQSVAFLPWFEEMNLGLALIAWMYISMVLKMHAFSECVNGMWQLSFKRPKGHYVDACYMHISFRLLKKNILIFLSKHCEQH